MIQEIFFPVFIIFLLTFIACLLTIGVFFLVKAFQTRFKNVFILGIGFTALPIGFIGNFIFSLGLMFQNICIGIGFSSAVIFTNLTFHQDKKSPGKMILIITMILALIQVFLAALLDVEQISFIYYLKTLLKIPYSLLSFNWLAYSSYQAYKQNKDVDIEPWIKARYKIIAICSFIMSIHVIPELFQPGDVRWGDPSDLMSLIVFGTVAVISVIFSIGFMLGWLMPNSLKKRINKDYRTLTIKTLPEEELIGLIKKELAETN